MGTQGLSKSYLQLLWKIERRMLWLNLEVNMGQKRCEILARGVTFKNDAIYSKAWVRILKGS